MATLPIALLLYAPLMLVWFAGPSSIVTAGAATVAAVTAIGLRRRGADAFFPWGMAVLMALASVATFAVAALAPRTLAAVLTGAVAALMLASVVAGRPWTAVASARDWRGMQSDALFLTINRAISAGWALVTAWIGVAIWLALPPQAHALPGALAGVASTVLPRWWSRRALARRLSEADPNPWPSPVAKGLPPSRLADGDADVIVVGAGIGGLTAAALLARDGARVIVLEQHDKPGGFCHHWEGIGQDGDAAPRFRFDAGVHDVSGVFEGGTVRSLLARLDLSETIDWRRLDHTFIGPAGRWDVPRDWSAVVEDLVRRAPSQAIGVRGLLADVRAIHAAMYDGAPARGGVPGMPGSPQGLIDFARAHPLATTWMERPFADLMDHHRLQGPIRQQLLGLAGYVTHDARTLRVRDHVPLLGYFIHGGHYPAGGSGALAQCLADSLALDGGELRLRTPVAGIVLDDRGERVRGVRLRDGRALHAAAIVMNGDPIAMARTLLPDTPSTRTLRAMLASARPATSMFMVHLGVRGDPPALPPVVHLEAGDQTLEIVFPSRVDPDAAPAGYHTIEIMALVPPGEAEGWFEQPELTDPVAQRGSDRYLARKARRGDAMIDALARLVPDVRARIVARYEASPLTFRRFGFSTQGAIYGLHPDLRLPRRSPLPGLVFAGAATHGPGVEAVMIAGAEAADALRPGLLIAR